MIRVIVFCYFFVVMSEFSVNGQSINNIDNFKISIPCKLKITYNQNSAKSFGCQVVKDNIPNSYRLTIRDFANTLYKFDDSGKKVFIEELLNKIRMNASEKSTNIKIRQFYNYSAIQFDNIVNMEDVSFNSRSFVFFYRSKLITINYVSIPKGFDSRFDEYLDSVTLVQ